MQCWDGNCHISQMFELRKWRHMHVRLAVNHSSALKRFNQKKLCWINKICCSSNYIAINDVRSFNKLWAKTKNYRFTLVNKHEGTTWHFLVTFDLNGVEGIVYCEHRKVCCNYCHKADVRPFLTSNHNFAPFIWSDQLVNSYLDDLLCSG